MGKNKNRKLVLTGVAVLIAFFGALETIPAQINSPIAFDVAFNESTRPQDPPPDQDPPQNTDTLPEEEPSCEGDECESTTDEVEPRHEQDDGSFNNQNEGEGLAFSLPFYFSFEARCGDGTIDHQEACDDGNSEGGDGCDSLCQVEPVTYFRENQNIDGTTEMFDFESEQNQQYEMDLFVAIDHAGNPVFGEGQTFTIKVDKTPPTFSPVTCTTSLQLYTDSAEPGEVLENKSYPTDDIFNKDNNKHWTNQDITCTYTVDDPNHEYNSQLRNWQHTLIPDREEPFETWQLEGGSLRDGTSLVKDEDVDAGMIENNRVRHGLIPNTHTFTTEQEVQYSFTGFATDHAGNKSDADDTTEGVSESWEQIVEINIDKTAPEFADDVKLSNGGGLRKLSSSLIKFEANETFDLHFNTIDKGGSGSVSGINLVRSFITITYEGKSDERTVSLEKRALDKFPFAGIIFEDASNVDSLINVTNPLQITDESDIFEKSGNYTISLVLRDRAEYVLASGDLLIEIVASEADEDTSLLEIQKKCVNNETEAVYVDTEGTLNSLLIDEYGFGSVYADNDGTCPVRMSFWDRFNNKVVNRSARVLFPKHDLRVSDYDLITDTNAAFNNGLRFGGGGTKGVHNNKQYLDLKIGATGKKAFLIRSLVPTIEIIPSSGVEAIEEAYLMRRTYKSASLQFQVQEMMLNGELNSETNQMVWTQIPRAADQKYAPKVKFEPWVKLFLSDSSERLGAGEKIYLMPGQQAIYGHATTALILDVSDNETPLEGGIALPPFRLDLSPHLRGGGEDVGYVDGVGHAKGVDGDGPYEVPYVGEIYYEIQPASHADSDIYLQLPPGLITGSIFVAFDSKIEYTVIDDIHTERTVRYPGGNFGNKLDGDTNLFNLESFPPEGASGANNSIVEILKIGADIEGQIITRDERSFSIADGDIAVEDSRMVRMGNLTQQDIREATTRNAYELIGGKSPEEVDVFDVTTCTGNKVFYFQASGRDLPVTVKGGTANAPAIVPGVCTVILEDRNLWIAEDFIYGDGNWNASIGFILINSIPVAYPEVGNIFVQNTVERFVGSYFADGTLTSTDWQSAELQTYDKVRELDRDAEGTYDPSSFGTQLLLEGTLLTRNTLGGSTISTMVDPWSDSTTDKEKAQFYDLDYVRRYNAREYLVVAEEGGVPSMSFRGDNPCVKGGGTSGCDINLHSFVIRLDGRVQTVPPPGFGN